MNKEEIAKSIDEGLKILKQEPSFIFNLEEIKAIDYLQFCYDISTIGNESLPKLGIALNLISKLQKELDKKDKVIDLIITDYLNLSKERMSKEEFKKWYFDLVGIKKVEEENE